MSRLLWQGTSVYNCHPRGPVTLTSNAKYLAVELSLPVLTIKVCRSLDSNTQPSACGENALSDIATIAATSFRLELKKYIIWYYIKTKTLSFPTTRIHLYKYWNLWLHRINNILSRAKTPAPKHKHYRQKNEERREKKITKKYTHKK